MSKFRDTGEVKRRISILFRDDLGFIKSANLAGQMVTQHWNHSVGDNYDQRALCILAASAGTLLNIHPASNEVMTYLWCHQKVTSKRGSFFFSIGTTDIERRAAHEWFMQKANVFAEQTKQTNYFQTLKPPPQK